jgi:hypothetical protein
MKDGAALIYPKIVIRLFLIAQFGSLSDFFSGSVWTVRKEICPWMDFLFLLPKKKKKPK